MYISPRPRAWHRRPLHPSCILKSAHAPCTALFIADNGVTLVLLASQRHVLCSCHVPLQFQGLDSSGEQFISTPHNKRVCFQSAQCRRGAFPPSERSHSWNTIFALPYVTRSPRHVTGAGPVMLPFTSENGRWQVGDPKSTTDGVIVAFVASHEHQDDNSQCYGVAHARMYGTVCRDSVMETAHQTQTRMMGDIF